LSEIKAIETVYNGYRFRSRLEARWAVYFDTLGIQYQYEKEGYDLGEAGRYLPDFWLPQVNMWAEVKAKALTEGERAKCTALCQKTGFSVLMLVSAPDFKEYSAIQMCKDGDDSESGADIREVDYTLCTEYLYSENRFFCTSCRDGFDEFVEVWPELLGAVNAARSARFEFGEMPIVRKAA